MVMNQTERIMNEKNWHVHVFTNYLIISDMLLMLLDISKCMTCYANIERERYRTLYIVLSPLL
jgi:hypothetical protein